MLRVLNGFGQSGFITDPLFATCGVVVLPDEMMALTDRMVF
jgi:hypothetical protein